MNRQTDDVLNEMTKGELIDWIRRHCPHKRPRRSELLYNRWDAASRAVLKEEQAEIDRFKASVNLAERDRMAKQFNESKNVQERARLIDKILAADKAVTDHFAAMEALDKKSKRIERLYRQHLDELEKERG